MADTPRTRAALIALAADNTSGDISANDLRDIIVSGPIGSDAQRSWRPSHFVGSYGAGTTYEYGDAVRALDGSDWKIYVSLIAANLAHNPVGDATGSWQDVVADGLPVIVEGAENPNTFGEQNRITHYTQDATGGSFDLGTATGIAWDAAQATIQTALDGAYGADKTFVNGDAADFTVEYYLDGTPMVLDDTNLTGGGLTLQVDTQDLVVGGFIAANASQYIEQSGGFTDSGLIWTYDGGQAVWARSYIANMDSGSSGPKLSASMILTRAGAGTSDVEFAILATRNGAGDGDVDAQTQAVRGGSGAGDVDATTLGRIEGTAVGAANAYNAAQHHTGGNAQVGPSADATGAYVGLGDPAAMGNGGLGHKLGDLVLAEAVDDTSAYLAINAIRQALGDLGMATLV